jgi:hypothetical protein
LRVMKAHGSARRSQRVEPCRKSSPVACAAMLAERCYDGRLTVPVRYRHPNLVGDSRQKVPCARKSGIITASVDPDFIA